jgi:hypothetical protein
MGKENSREETQEAHKSSRFSASCAFCGYFIVCHGSTYTTGFDNSGSILDGNGSPWSDTRTLSGILLWHQRST